MNLQKLKDKISEKGLLNNFIAEKLRINKSTFSLKINGDRKFTIDEFKNLCTLLNISDEERNSIFFEDDVDKNNNKFPASPITLNPQEDEMTDQEAMDYLFGRKKG